MSSWQAPPPCARGASKLGASLRQCARLTTTKRAKSARLRQRVGREAEPLEERRSTASSSSPIPSAAPKPRFGPARPQSWRTDPRTGRPSASATTSGLRPVEPSSPVVTMPRRTEPATCPHVARALELLDEASASPRPARPQGSPRGAASRAARGGRSAPGPGPTARRPGRRSRRRNVDAQPRERATERPMGRARLRRPRSAAPTTAARCTDARSRSTRGAVAPDRPPKSSRSGPITASRVVTSSVNGSASTTQTLARGARSRARLAARFTARPRLQAGPAPW